METAGISLPPRKSGAEGPHFDAEHACSADTTGEIVAFSPEIAVWNKNNMNPAAGPGQGRRRQMT
jgi:hypothetical protein